ncbi:hypothetical protein BCY84_13960 [Trypanosoma cruzi cruzi]|uniref:HECT domain-containing protein n=1 Tax=Trypanosoma cruzi TaxID=5693 RepID=A0A2V2W2R2_TRYCR|nr:hypothetical protein BCY84_13960 [Trypanosoma cruzi cruzi]PWV02367.1 hypothetical protein C4B63_2g88 [Trypanosoma cruzi]
MSVRSEVQTENSKQQLKAVQCQRNDPDKVLEPLEKLCISLVMGVEPYLRSFDAATAIPILLCMTEKEFFSFCGDTMTMLLRALALIMEYVPSAYESVHLYHKRLMKSVCQVLSRTLLAKMKYNNTDNVMLLEESLRLIQFITKDEGNISVLRFGVTDVIRIAASENTLLARQAFDVLVTICSKIILPSDVEKLNIIGLSSFLICGRKKKSKKGCLESLDSHGKIRVYTVENVIVPFLHSTLQQYSASLETFPEAWTFLELTIHCLGMLMRRSMLSHRPSTTRKIVTRDMCRTLFRLLLFNDTNVAIDQSVRSERILLCETVLDAAMAADSLVASEFLLAEEAVSFYKLLLGEQESGIITQLDDPFPVSGGSSRSTQRRDKNNIVSIAAIRLFVLACPRVLSEAFGPKPKVLLPVHQWYWEDELRNSNSISEEGCVTLETGFCRLCKETPFRMHMKSLRANFQSMKLSGGFGSGERNISRKIVPFVFHFVDEADLRLVKSAKEAMMLCNPTPKCRRELGVINASEAAAISKGLGELFIINRDSVVPPLYMSIAEMFLESLCSFVVSVSGQMAMQLGTSACASLLQAAICTEENQRLAGLLSKIIRPLCEMLREALVSGDKATKSVSLTMMVWLLCHPQASVWNFSETALRCGVVNQLEILLSGGAVVSSKKTKPHKGLTKVGPEVKQTRTAYLAASALAVLRAINKQLSKTQSPRSERSLSTMDVMVVRKAVNELKICAATPGLHQGVVARILELMEKSANTVTAYEFSTLGIADAVLKYLLVEHYKDYCRDAVTMVGTATPSVATGSTEVKEESFVGGIGQELTEGDLLAFAGTRTANGLHQRCQKERLQCFLESAMQRPRGVKALIENLVSALPLHSTFPLVESLLGPSRATCRPPTKAVLVGSHISPIVSLCSKPDIESDAAKRWEFERRNSKTLIKQSKSCLVSMPMQPDAGLFSGGGVEVVHSRDNCPRGHRLLAISEGQSLGLCDMCEEEIHTGFCCHRCEFYICKDCYTDPKVQYSNATSGASPSSGAAAGGILGFVAQSQQQQQQQTSQERQRQQYSRPIIRAHLFSSIGDIERYFRTGSYSTRNTDVAPAPQSVLQNIDYFVERAKSFLARKRLNCSDEILRKEVHRILSSFLLNGPTIDPEATAEDVTDEHPLGPKELQELRRLLRDAMEERYVLYTAPGGRCAYQETLIGNFLRRAIHEGNLGVVEQLETCLLSIEGYCESSNGLQEIHRDESLLLRQDEVGLPPPWTDVPERSSNARTYMFHHFEKDEDTRCLCGKASRTELNSMYPPKLVRKPSRLSQNPDTLLLILLQKLLSPLIKQGAMDIDAGLFVSAPFTTLVVKSLAASALRVALLPPRLAVPRWADFVITEANFLLPLNVRERVARFFAYGARRALHSHLKASTLSRSNRSINVYPAEWGRWANHKYRVSRESLLHDAYTVLQKSADSRLPISIEFDGDVGVGQGPTAHFYTLIAEEVKKAKLRLWRTGAPATKTKDGSTHGDMSSGDARVVPPAEGLYPFVSAMKDQCRLFQVSSWQQPGGATMLTDRFTFVGDYAEFDRERARCYYLIGSALGRAFTDELVFPLDLSPALSIFLSRGAPAPCVFFSGDTIANKGIERPIDFMGLSLDDVDLMDRSVATSLRSLLSLSGATLKSLAVPFTLPGHDNFEMITGGSEKLLTKDSVAQYIRRVSSGLLYESAVLPIQFLIRGFRDIVPCEALASLGEQEMMSLLCGCRANDKKPLWTLAEIKSILVAEHGYQTDSPQMTMLQNILANRLTPAEQRSFLLFCTGCPRLPVGGVGALGAITVVKRSDFTMFHGSSGRNSGGSNGIGGADGKEQNPKQPGEWNSLPNETDWPLPSVNTCFRYLKLPPYPTEDLMYKKLRLSIMQGGETFQLS